MPDFREEAPERAWEPDLHVLESRRVNLARQGWTFDLWSPFWRLYVNDRSGAYVEHAGRRLDLAPGRLWLIPAWVHFRTGLRGRVVQDYVHFTFTGFPAVLMNQHFDRPISLRTAKVPAPLIARWRGTIADAASFARLSHAYALAHAATAVLLSGWGRREWEICDRWRLQTGAIRPALERLENSLAHPPGNAELSRACGLSEDHFIRKFRRLAGITPAEYGRRHRVARAAEWLTGTSRTLEDIAEAAGFVDRFHFSRIFKSRFDLTPIAYRRRHRLETQMAGGEKI